MHGGTRRRCPRSLAAAAVTLAVVATTGVLPVPAASARTTTVTVVIPRGGMQKGFAAKAYRLTRGATLKIANRDTIRHSLTSVAENSHGVPLLDTVVAPGATVTVARANTLRAGSYRFYCRFHPGMRATLTVAGSGGTTSAGAVTFDQPLTFPRQMTWTDAHITIKSGLQHMLPGGPATKIVGFDGTYPGPTIRRTTGQDTRVTFTNGVGRGTYSVHLHGDHHSSADDGQPMTNLLGAGQSHIYDYPLVDDGRPVPPSFGFYHDHVMNWTGAHAWVGAQGMFIVDDGREESLGLPTGYWDRPLMIADRSFTSANQLVPVGPGTGGRPTTGATAPPSDATVGNRVLVNGRYRPYFTVQGHRYRLRLLNAANHQSYDFLLNDGRSFLQVGTGSSLLPHPVARRDILLGPAQRADVVVDFHGLAGRNVTLWSVPRTDGSKTGIGTPLTPIMQFRVGKDVAGDRPVAAALEATPSIDVPSSVSATWDFGLGGNSTTGTYWTINGRTYDPDRVDLTVPLGSTQRWRLHNSSPMTHYVHLHEEQWHTILRDGKPPPAYEQGLQDTWRLDPGESVEVAARFTDYTGAFMIHCHMLDHEDDGMMARFDVVAPGATGSTRAAGPAAAFVSRTLPDAATTPPSAPSADEADAMADMPGMASDASPAAHPAVVPAPAPAGSGLLDALLGAGAVLALGLAGWVPARRLSRRPRRPYRAAPS